jgi:hypothetical protein
MDDEKRADEETLPDTPLHGNQEGRALEDGEHAEGGPVEDRDEGDEPLGASGEASEPPDRSAGDERMSDDTPTPDESIGNEGLGTQAGAFDPSKREPREETSS